MHLLRQSQKYSFDLLCLYVLVFLDIFELWVYSEFLIEFFSSNFILGIVQKGQHSSLPISEFPSEHKIITLALILLDYFHDLFLLFIKGSFISIIGSYQGH